MVAFKILFSTTEVNFLVKGATSQVSERKDITYLEIIIYGAQLRALFFLKEIMVRNSDF